MTAATSKEGIIVPEGPLIPDAPAETILLSAGHRLVAAMANTNALARGASIRKEYTVMVDGVVYPASIVVTVNKPRRG